MIVNEKGVLSFKRITEQIRHRADIILFGEIETKKLYGKELIFEHLIFPGHSFFLLPASSNHCCVGFPLSVDIATTIKDIRNKPVTIRDEEKLLSWRINLSEQLKGRILVIENLEWLINYFEAKDRKIFNFLIFNLDVFQVSK